MIILEITMDEIINISSIKLKVNNSLGEYLSKEGVVSVKATPSSCAPSMGAI